MYLRFSDQRQIGNTSIETQERDCRAYCERMDWEIVDVIKKEAVSADGQKGDDRIIEITDYCRNHKGKFQALVVWKSDRFARDVLQHQLARREMLKYGVVLRSATENIDDTANGKLLESFLASLNEYDNENRRLRARRSSAQLIENGLYPHQAPVGYKSIRKPGEKLKPYIFDDLCVNYIRDMFDYFAAGQMNKAQLARYLEKFEIYKTSYRHQDNKKRIYLPEQTIDNILRNPYYAGRIWSQLEPNKLIKGQHQPLITWETFEKIQHRLSKESNNATTKRLSVNPDLPLKKFILCPHCGKPMTGYVAKHKYPYYNCYNDNCPLNDKANREQDVKQYFLECLDRVTITDVGWKKLKVKLKTRLKSKLEEVNMDCHNKQVEIDELERKLAGYLEEKMSTNCDTVKDFCDKQISEISSKLESYKNCEIKKVEIDYNELIEYAEDFIRTFKKSWLESGVELKNRLQRFIFPDGLIYRPGNFSNLKTCRLIKIIHDCSEKDSLCDPCGI